MDARRYTLPADARWLRDALEQADLSDPPEVTR